MPESFEHDRLTVVDRADDGRYELILDGARVGMATYFVDGDVVSIPRVETHAEHRGKDFAARLMAGILLDVRKRSMHVRPLCWYAAEYLRDHPEQQDLVA